MKNIQINLDRVHTDTETPLGFEIYENAVPNCDLICDYLNTQEWLQSTTIGGLKTEVRNSYSIPVDFLNPYSLPEDIFNMNKIVWQKMQDYCSRWGFAISYLEPASIQKYNPGEGFYGVHYDGEHRAVSALVYLNDVEEGGETVFPEFDLWIKPEIGKLVIFPSNYIYRHAAMTPKSNTKYSAAYWGIAGFMAGNHMGHRH